MKQRAILYTRVSTDEQNNGYSPADQKDRLTKYCEQNNIDVIAFYHDDESGKTFDRPEWLNIMSYLKKNSNSVDLLLFIKWDRFSRNSFEAYTAINSLQKFGVQPHAIEQPLNLEIPEQKLMLAIYLAAPEVDNDRRTLNIFHGMRRAKKDGRWLGNCPKGYINTRDDKNKPIILPEGGLQETLIKRAFSEYATGLYNIEELRKKLYKEGLKLTKNAFAFVLKNKTYTGKIFVQAYKDEPAQWVEGIHDGIIEDSLFYDVQDVLVGKKRKLPNKIKTVREELPLRGFLECPRCGRTLTGSASTGRSGEKFFYYHCDKGCKERINAIETNKVFSEKLKMVKINSELIELFMATLKRKLKSNSNDNKSDIEKVLKEIDKNKTRLKNAQILMLDGELNSLEYKEMKIKIEEDLLRLAIDENKLRSNTTSHDKLIDTCTKVVQNLDIAYEKADAATKQRIIGSIFPKKFQFVNNQARTASINELINQICSKIKSSKANKKGQQFFYELLPNKVLPIGRISNDLVEDARKLAELHDLLIKDSEARLS
jgi:site-specific DNA recombinase